MTTWRVAMATDTGRVREANEDAGYVDERLAVVADGMGGHAAGEVASAIAVREFREHVAAHPSLAGLETALSAANSAIMRDAQANPGRAGMGTTLAAVVLVEYGGDRAPAWVNIGDSRIYQLRDGALKQLTQDHSVAEEWFRQGRLTAEEAAVHPSRHQLTRVLGMPEEPRGDVGVLSAQAGDRIVLCSDGLSNEVTNEEIVALASAPTSLDDAARNLVARANQNGGHDNITVAIIEFDHVAATVPDEALAPIAAPVVPNRPSTTTVRRRSRQISWRQVGFLGAFAGLLIAAMVVLNWYNASSYYLGASNGDVAVFQGQPHGFLWFHPQQVLDTGYRADQLLPGDAAALQRTIAEPSLAAAIAHASNLHDQWVSATNGNG